MDELQQDIEAVLLRTLRKFQRRRGVSPDLDAKLGVYHAIQRGNFIGVMLMDDRGDIYGMGFSKRNPIDPRNNATGLTIAAWRAYEDAHSTGRLFS